MLNTINNLYQAGDLYGECLCIPLKRVNRFFEIREDQSVIGKLARVIVKVVLGIFIYPLAAIGVLIKAFQIPSVIAHNKKDATLNYIFYSIPNKDVFFLDDNTECAGKETILAYEFDVTKQNLNMQRVKIQEALDSLSERYIKAYALYKSRRENDQGIIRISLYTLHT